MISPTANWQTRNAGIKKKPIFLIEVEGYNRSFATAPGIGSFPGISSSAIIQVADRITDFGGFTGFPGDVTLANATPAGNLLFAFLYENDFGGSLPVSISDTAGNTWTSLASTPGASIWWATAVAAPAGNIVTFVTGGTRGNCEFFVCEVSSIYSGFAFGHASASGGLGTVASVTVGSNIISVPNIDVLSSWEIYGIALAPPSGPLMGVNLAFVLAGYSLSDQFIVGGAASQLASSGLSTSYDWIVSIDPIQISVSDLDGGADLADFVFNIQDTAETITADLKLFTFEGKRCILKHGFGKQVGNQVVFDSTFPLSDYLTRFTGKINSVANDNGNQEYKFTVPDIRKDMSKVIYQTGDDGFPTDSTHTRTVSGHPLDILISILQNELGYTTSAIDIAGITAYRDTVLSGIEFSFVIDSPPAAKDFIENELMKPLGAYHFPDNNGVVKVHFFYPISPVTVATLDHANLGTVPAAGQADLVNQVTFRFDKSSSNFLSESLQQWQPSITKFGLFGEQVIESAGLRSAFIGFFIAQFIARLIFLRYGDKQLQIEDLQTIFDDSSLLEPGDYVLVTSSLLPDRAQGMVGVTAKTFEVMDRTWDCIAGITTLKLLEIDLSLFRQFLITPNGEADFTADTALNQAKYMYLSDAAGLYSDGSKANTLC